MNDEFVLRQAQLFADRVEEAAPGDAAEAGRPGVSDRLVAARRAKRS